jgi:hypothetical protein
MCKPISGQDTQPGTGPVKSNTGKEKPGTGQRK